jgi:hypothetical protein
MSSFPLWINHYIQYHIHIEWDIVNNMGYFIYKMLPNIIILGAVNDKMFCSFSIIATLAVWVICRMILEQI